ncbi:MAG: hypothetical protein AAF456_21210 [Planctomycetota bacterium]
MINQTSMIRIAAGIACGVIVAATFCVSTTAVEPDRLMIHSDTLLENSTLAGVAEESIPCSITIALTVMPTDPILGPLGGEEASGDLDGDGLFFTNCDDQAMVDFIDAGIYNPAGNMNEDRVLDMLDILPYCEAQIKYFTINPDAPRFCPNDL